jgi:hypothetical protein
LRRRFVVRWLAEYAAPSFFYHGAILFSTTVRSKIDRHTRRNVAAIDVSLLRSDTPGVANVLHFNNAGAALPPRPVLDAVASHVAREAAIGGYEAAAEAADRIADVYNAVAT